MKAYDVSQRGVVLRTMASIQMKGKEGLLRVLLLERYQSNGEDGSEASKVTRIGSAVLVRYALDPS